MDKIFELALKGIGIKNTENVIKVINATPVPEIAAEMILGVYEYPILKKESKYKKDAKLISFNPLKGYYAVEFSYDKENTVCIYYNKLEETKEKAKERWYALENKSDWKNFEVNEFKNGESEYTYVNTGEFEMVNDSCTIDQWNEVN